MIQLPTISVVVPVFNESARIQKTLDRIREYHTKTNFIKELIIVDDASTDSTVSLIESYISEYSIPIKFLKNKKNRGKGYSVKKGALVSSGDYMLFADADNSVDIENLSRFMEHTKDADIVIASISTEGGQIYDGYSKLRKLAGRVSKFIINSMVLSDIDDTQRGFKLFSQKAVQIIFPKQTINRWGFDIEILLIAKTLNLKVKELPVYWNNPKSTSINIFSYVKTFFELLTIKKNQLFGKYK